MKNIRETQVLQKILLPLNADWEVSEVQTDELTEEIYVKLRYNFDYVKAAGVRYSIYDRRKERKWRHLDLWQYKTWLIAEVPHYKDHNDNFKTITLPWAEESSG
jgi:hypothetical protein